jgi:hypothetical protein
MRLRCKWCRHKLVNPSPRKEFCDGTCRAAHAHAKAGTPGRPTKPLRSVATDRKRAIRDGVGTKIYVLPDEAGDLAALLAAVDALMTAPLERLATKAATAVDRIERKAA